MRKLLPGVVIALVMMIVCLLPAAQADSEAPKPQPALTLDQMLDENGAVCAQEKMSVESGQADDSIILCGRYQGTPCDGSSRPRCFLQPGEPALCFCVNGLYDCS